MYAKTFIVLLLLYVSVFPEPPKLPKEAEWDSINQKYYAIFINQSKTEWKSWNKDGELVSEGIETKNYFEVTIYKDRRWFERVRTTYLGHWKEEQLPPKIKPTNIPKESSFNFELRKWEWGIKKNNKRDGLWNLWWPDGKPAGMVEYESDIFHGRVKLVYENGKVAETGNYWRGKKEGEFRTFYESGNIMDITPYKDGLIHGIYVLYRENGDEFLRYFVSKGKITSILGKENQ